MEQSTDIKRLVTLRLNPGDDILLSLRQAVEENNIQSGLILNGAGSVSSYHFHVVDSADLPPAEAFSKAEVPCDIASMSGSVIDGRVHAHILLGTRLGRFKAGKPFFSGSRIFQSVPILFRIE